MKRILMVPVGLTVKKVGFVNGSFSPDSGNPFFF
jgi:hypothetical protein